MHILYLRFTTYTLTSFSEITLSKLIILFSDAMLTHNINVPVEGGFIDSTIHKPPEAKVIVLISHAPGSGRFNLRNKKLAEQLAGAGFATLLYDWSRVKEFHKNINHLKMGQNLAFIIRWLKSHRTFKDLSPVLYGSGTGAAFSIIAASEMGDSVKAVVSRNGRLELADNYLHKVKSATFLAVGDKDYRLLELNKKAYKKLECPKKFVVVPGITPFFEEPKKVERVGQLSIEWIQRYSRSDVPSKNKIFEIS